MTTRKHIQVAAILVLALGTGGVVQMARSWGAEAVGSGSAPSLSVLLERGLHQEKAGRLDEAMKTYRKVIEEAKANRRNAATAMIHLAGCQVKKSQPLEAAETLEKLIRTFPNQKDLLADARKLLTRARGKITGEQLDRIVQKAVLVISTCTEWDPRVTQQLDRLKPLNSAAVVRALKPFLASKKDTIRRSAVYILWRGELKGTSAAAADLIALCSHEEDMTRGMAALALGVTGADSALKKLCEMTLKERSGYARRCAAYALGQLGNPKAKSTLEKAMKDRDRQVRNNAEAALRLLGLLGDEAVGPKVTASSPAALANDVSPKLTKISVTFDRPMKDGCWSWVQIDKETFPEMGGKPSFDKARTTCSLPVKLRPGKVYWVGINTEPYTNFQDNDGHRAQAFVLLFATKTADGKPTKIDAKLLAKARAINEAAAASAGKRASENLATQGWKLWGQRKLLPAEIKFQEAVRLDPKNVKAWNGLGWALQNQGKAAKAKVAFNKCLALEPKHAAALNGLGWIAKIAGDTDQAIGYWTRAIEAEPKAAAALAGLARTMTELGKHDQAVKYYELWLKAAPDNAQVKANLAKARLAAKEAKPK